MPVGLVAPGCGGEPSVPASKEHPDINETPIYEYEIQRLYGNWECLSTATSVTEARQILADYNREDPTTAHRIRRVKAAQ